MKKLVTALTVAGGLAVAGSAAMADPVSRPVGPVPDARSLYTPVQYGGGYGGGYGYRYRPHCYYVRRCSGYYPYQRCWQERVCD